MATTLPDPKHFEIQTPSTRSPILSCRFMSFNVNRRLQLQRHGHHEPVWLRNSRLDEEEQASLTLLCFPHVTNVTPNATPQCHTPCFP